MDQRLVIVLKAVAPDLAFVQSYASMRCDAIVLMKVETSYKKNKTQKSAEYKE